MALYGVSFVACYKPDTGKKMNTLKLLNVTHYLLNGNITDCIDMAYILWHHDHITVTVCDFLQYKAVWLQICLKRQLLTIDQQKVMRHEEEWNIAYLQVYLWWLESLSSFFHWLNKWLQWFRSMNIHRTERTLDSIHFWCYIITEHLQHNIIFCIHDC